MSKLNLIASSSSELLTQLSATDIKVPAITDGRCGVHRERYLMAYFLATKAESLFQYPISIQHREKPDFEIHEPDRITGVECVEAVPLDWYGVQAIRERKHPDSINIAYQYKIGAPALTLAEKEEIAAGNHNTYPWMGNAPAVEWASAMAHVVEIKTTKLRSGNYDYHKNNWLLIQDECRAPLLGEKELNLALNLCMPLLAESLRQPSFSKIFINARGYLATIESHNFTIEPINYLWSQS